jgi:SAM-dependent methyltransferase
MKIKDPWKRLEVGQFWREVDAEHNRIIANELIGVKRVLDIGCGYGSLTNYLYRLGFEVTGIDSDKEMIGKGKDIFPDLKDENLQTMDAMNLSFQNNFFEAMILRDCLHHLYQEGNVDAIFSEIERVLQPGGLLVVFDPQPNFVVRLARSIAKHQDAQCTVKEATDLLVAKNWKINNKFFTESFALALSGGYVGYVLVPQWHFLHRALIVLNRISANVINWIGLGRFVLWRYVIVASWPDRA